MTWVLLWAKNVLKQYLTFIIPIYAKYTEGLWGQEVSSAAQLVSQSCMHACGYVYDRNVFSSWEDWKLIMHMFDVYDRSVSSSSSQTAHLVMLFFS